MKQNTDRSTYCFLSGYPGFRRYPIPIKTPLILILGAILATIFGSSPAQTAPLAQTTQTITITASEDIGIIESSPNTNGPEAPYFVLSNRSPNGDFDYNLMAFDLSAIPIDATLLNAQLQIYIRNAPANDRLNVEMGRVDGAWEETSLTWNTQPAITWNGAEQNIPGVGPVSWPIQPLLKAWLDGTRENFGVALRGRVQDTGLVQAKTINGADNPGDEDGFWPRLVIQYSVPDDPQPRPDLGDAPDSSNHHNVSNTAYRLGNVAGQFPTVWKGGGGNQPAGPRHANESGEGILGQYLSREVEADQGADQDGPNNILQTATPGVIADIADQDRGDDGWRNRNILFEHCRRQTLTVRVSKAPAASLEKMYLNVWHDGNRDGDWADSAPCISLPGLPNRTSYEWIVQDYVVDMTAIPAGGFVDLQINTQRVLNTDVSFPHWMRFTLSEDRAVVPPNNSLPDGRGPHPTIRPDGFQFGETEDIFHKAPLVGEDGQLILEKRILDADAPVDYAGTVTYQIRLRHEGGTQPVEATIRDVLPYPLHLLSHLDSDGNVVLVDVSSSTGGVAPLAAEVDYVGTNPIEQRVRWQGTLQPDAVVVLTFEVHVHPFCRPNQQTETIRNIAEAQPENGDPMSAEATFTAKCPGYDAGQFEFGDPEVNPTDPSEWLEYHTGGGYQGDILYGNDHTWRTTMQNPYPISATIGFFQNPNLPGVISPTQKTRFISRVTFGPNEQKPISLNLRETAQPDDDLVSADDAPFGQVRFCILVGEDNVCPDAVEYPHLVGNLPLPVVPRPDDLGDAPDSSNHAGTPMTAYPGVEAHFPTVFDPATGLPPGPKHHRPWALHLGPAASIEAEADVGPDADGSNNIVPPANLADQDWFDDGSQLTNLAHCQPARAGVRVFVTPQVANRFANQNRVAYLNVWLDSNRDGDWEDGFTCVDTEGQNKDVVEHILIDYPIDVAALGAGLHNLPNIPTNFVGWPQQLANQPAWMRFTLSEEPANKPLNFANITYGDGRGYTTPFRVGETEDHLWQPNNGEADGPDLAIRVAGRLEQNEVLERTGNRRVEAELGFKVSYANVGTQPTTNAMLIFNKTGAVQSLDLKTVTGAGIDPADVTDNPNALTVALPNLAPNETKSLIIRLGPIATPITETYSATAEIVMPSDIKLANNRAITAVDDWETPVSFGAVSPQDNLWRLADTTCRNTLTLNGRGEPRETLNLKVNGADYGPFQFNDDGVLSNAQIVNLSEGVNEITAADFTDNAMRIAVDSSLPIDPISLLLEDSNGKQYHPETLGFSFGVEREVWHLPVDETYTISIDSCLNEPNTAIRLVLADGPEIPLQDADGDGTYTGVFTYDGPAGGHNPIGLDVVVETEGTAYTYQAEIEPVLQGTVLSQANGQPLADAQVVAEVASGAGTYTVAGSTLTPDANPQTTAADGQYQFAVPNGVYRLTVTRDGYQPYRTPDVAVTGGDLARDITLSATINEPADHTVYITDQGFIPTTLEAKPGDIIEWVNADTADHATQHSTGWQSGVLGSGQRYQIQLHDEGSYPYTDAQNQAWTGTIIVKTEVPSGGSEHWLYLPAIQK